MNLIIFGTGQAARQILEYKTRIDVSILCLCDNNKDNWGKIICGYEIVSPEQIAEVKYDKILLAMWNGEAMNEILDQLMRMGVDQTRIDYSYDPKAARYCKCNLDDFFCNP